MCGNITCALNALPRLSQRLLVGTDPTASRLLSREPCCVRRGIQAHCRARRTQTRFQRSLVCCLCSAQTGCTQRGRGSGSDVSSCANRRIAAKARLLRNLLCAKSGPHQTALCAYRTGACSINSSLSSLARGPRCTQRSSGNRISELLATLRRSGQRGAKTGDCPGKTLLPRKRLRTCGVACLQDILLGQSSCLGRTRAEVCGSTASRG